MHFDGNEMARGDEMKYIVVECPATGRETTFCMHDRQMTLRSMDDSKPSCTLDVNGTSRLVVGVDAKNYKKMLKWIKKTK